MSIRILTGDCRDVLATLPERSVQCCVTSPPYFGLRDYGTASWDGGDPACDHKHQLGGEGEKSAKQNTSAGMQLVAYRDACRKCGAVRTDSQIGLEQTPDAYVAELVAVFREVRRVLRDDGTLWLNIGDSYAGNGANRNGLGNSVIGSGPDGACKQRDIAGAVSARVPPGLKHKDLIGIPWLVAFALRADGWYLRQDIIWAKPNPMPESVTDRCTKAHEYVFLLSKSARYFFDAKAIAEEASGRDPGNVNHKLVDESLIDDHHRTAGGLLNVGARDTRNRRSVWNIASQPYSGAHFATMPPDLAETCIKAGSSERGQCPTCGAPLARQIEVESRPNATDNCSSQYGGYRGISGGVGNDRRKSIDNGWAPSCSCPAHQPVPQMILDPFGGAGTTALVADRLQRNAVIVELNAEYAAMARDRLNGDGGLFAEVAAE